MYIKFFGLKREPFSMTADPDFLTLTPQHREALAGLMYSMLAQRGIAVLTGDVGTGKTTLLNKALQFYASSGVRASLIRNPTLTTSEFLEGVLMGFGISQVPSTKTQRLRILEDHVVANHKSGSVSAVIVDEAHALSPELLEEVRLLGNIERGDCKLLQILLVGQSELDDLLNRDELRQLKQRVAMRFAIGPLQPADINHYICHRWSCAGGTVPPPISSTAITAVGTYAKGLPRLINSICDNALVLAFAEQSTCVTERHVQQAAADLHVLPKTPKAVAAAAPAELAAPLKVKESQVTNGAVRRDPVVPSAVAVAEAPVLRNEPNPPAAETADVQVVFKSLERYTAAAENRSLLARCVGWLGLTH